MKIILVTPNEPFYLAENLKYFIEILNKKHNIVACVLQSPTPFGKRKSSFQKVKETYKIFGFKFVFYYSFQLVINKLFTPSVKRILQRNDVEIINLIESVNSKKSISIIKNTGAELVVSILGNQIFKSPLLNATSLGCINLHTSLLPIYRGMMPTFWVMKNNEKTTGVSVFHMDEGIDSGPIICQKEVIINSNDTQKKLIKRTKKIGMELISKAIDLIEDGQLEYIINEQNKSSYYGFPNRQDVKHFKKQGKKFF